jgi:uncharacterized protein with HEPN domain
MPPEVLKLLTDMQETASDIAAFAVGKFFGDFQKENQTRMAIERGFEIVGEAFTQLRKIDPTTAEQISDLRAIIGFRNVLIHGYGQVDHAKTWDIVQTEVPILLAEINNLLKKLLSALLAETRCLLMVMGQ